MNKKEIIEVIAKDLDITKKDAKRAFELTFENIEKSLKKEKRFMVPGFGTFKLAQRKARTARNPQTGATIKIKARKAVTFKPSTTLKEKFN